MLKVKTSTIPNAGKGLFATVDISKNTKLGEYKGKRLSEQQFQRTADTSYVWEVSARGKNVYVDARRRVANNPLRYVNGAIFKRQKKKVNVEMYQYGQKVFYRTTKKESHLRVLTLCFVVVNKQTLACDKQTFFLLRPCKQLHTVPFFCKYILNG